MQDSPEVTGAVLATPSNMAKYERPNLVVYSPTSGEEEEYSATPGDYWYKPKHEALYGSNDEPLFLGVRVNGFVIGLDEQVDVTKKNERLHREQVARALYDALQVLIQTPEILTAILSVQYDVQGSHGVTGDRMAVKQAEEAVFAYDKVFGPEGAMPGVTPDRVLDGLQ